MRFSIIIPVYNCEKYIEECVDSVLKQTYNDYEIIIINDGSTDNSYDIIRKKYKNMPKVKIIDKSNTGVSDTRNLGIKEAKGEWIVFLDADDLIQEKCLEKLSNIINKNKEIEAISFGMQELINGINKKNQNNFINKCFKDKETIYNFVLSEKFSKKYYGFELGSCCGVGGKAFKKHMIINNNIMFPKDLFICEDTYFDLQCFLHSKDIYFYGENLYYYRLHSESATHKYNDAMYENAVKFCDKMVDFCNDKNLKLEAFYYRCFNLYKDIIAIICKTNIPDDIKYTKIHEIMNNNYFNTALKTVKLKYYKLNEKIFLITIRLRLIKTLIYMYKIKK